MRQSMVVLLAVVALVGGVKAQQLGQSEQRAIGSWTLVEHRDVMTDEVDLFVAVSADEGASGFKSLAIGCMRGEADIMLSHGYLSGDPDRMVKVEFRFDQHPVIGPEYWKLTRNQKFSTLNGARALTLISRFLRAGQVIIRIRDPHDGELLTTLFRLSRTREAFAQLPCLGVGPT